MEELPRAAPTQSGSSALYEAANRDQVDQEMEQTQQRYTLAPREFDLLERIIRVEQGLKSLLERLICLEQEFKSQNERLIRVEQELKSQNERLICLEKELKSQRDLIQMWMQQMDKRFEQMDKRFTFIQWTIGLGFTLLGVLIAVMRFF